MGCMQGNQNDDKEILEICLENGLSVKQNEEVDQIVHKILEDYEESDHETKLNLKIPINTKHSKCLPFIPSRNAAAILLSYYGDIEEVYELMRRLSHRARAYLVNAGGLKGFLVPYSLENILQKVLENGQLELVASHQDIQLNTVIKELK